MTIDDYLQRKDERQKAIRCARATCSKCKKPNVTCYCQAVRPFSSAPLFVILIHKMEVRRSVATGRMAHLCMKNSRLFEGTDFSDHAEVNAFIENPNNYCVVLSPGAQSVNLSGISEAERKNIFPNNKQLVIFVIDGTWAQARRMKRLSTNLHSLRAICFTPQTPSKFHVRRQPAAYCYATIEAIHALIELCGWGENKSHDTLLTAFSYMVEQQVQYELVNGIPRGMRALRGAR